MNDVMDSCALKFASQYILDNFDITRNDLYFDSINVPVVIQKCTILKNFKYVIATKLLEDMLFEVTYDGQKQEWHLNAYKKFESKSISMIEAMDSVYD